MCIHQWHYGRLHIACSDLLGDLSSSRGRDLAQSPLRSPGTELLTWKMVLKSLFAGDTEEETLHIYYSGLPGHSSLSQYSFPGRWSWNGHSSGTLGKTLHIHCSVLLGERAFQVGGVLLRRWSCNSYALVTLGLYVHCWGLPGQSSSIQKISTQKIILKWLFVDYSGKETLQFHHLGVLGYRALQVSNVLLGTLSWSACSWVSLRKCHYLDLLGDRGLHIRRVILRRSSWNARPLGGDTEEGLNGCCFGLLGQCCSTQ